MIALLFLILVVLIGEAKWESLFGDRHGVLSNVALGMTMVCVTCFGWWFCGYQYGWLLYWAIRMCIFDYLFNYFKGNKWSYLGNNFVDRFVKKINPLALLCVRIIIFYEILNYYLKFDRIVGLFSGYL